MGAQAGEQSSKKAQRDCCLGPSFFFSFFFLTLLLSSFWTSRGHRCRPFFPPVLAFNLSTSWAGQEALIGTLSQYHTQFWEFGSEILTRDLKQAEQHIQTRMQKKKCPPTARPKFLLKLEAGKRASYFFYFRISLLLFFLTLIQITCQNFRS